VRSVGSPEPLFILLILSSLFFFEKKNYLLAGLLGGLATMTKTPGILLFPAYILTIIETSLTLFWQAEGVSRIKTDSGQARVTVFFNLKWLYLFLIPLSLLAVFGLYYMQYDDFFAYFHTGGTVPMPYPFSVFNSSAQWVGTAWLEDTLFYFALYLSTAVVLWKSKYRSFFYFSFLFSTSLLFIQHRDISRYSLPLWPLACIAFEHIFTSKKALLVGVILFAGIYMYTWNFLGSNVMPISEWLPFL